MLALRCMSLRDSSGLTLCMCAYDMAYTLSTVSKVAFAALSLLFRPSDGCRLAIHAAADSACMDQASERR